MMKLCAWIVALAFGLAACADELPRMPSGQAAYALIPATSADGRVSHYKIGPLDTISVTVFQEPDLSSKGLQVDTTGKVFIPLVGEVQAGGKTSSELAEDLQTRFGARYLVNPQVAVSVQESVSQKVTVEGSVNEAGVYELKGRTTLLDALAMARGMSRTAKLDQVAVFRNVAGRRAGAVFNILRINAGEAPDPEILGGDLIVVGTSHIRQAWVDVLSSSPLISAVRP